MAKKEGKVLGMSEQSQGTKGIRDARTLGIPKMLLLAIAAIAGIVMNAILPGNDYEFGTNEKGDENRGIHA